MTAELRGLIVQLRRQGVVQDAIADVLNLSDRRVAEVLRAA